MHFHCCKTYKKHNKIPVISHICAFVTLIPYLCKRLNPCRNRYAVSVNNTNICLLYIVCIAQNAISTVAFGTRPLLYELFKFFNIIGIFYLLREMFPDCSSIKSERIYLCLNALGNFWVWWPPPPTKIVTTPQTMISRTFYWINSIIWKFQVIILLWGLINGKYKKIKYIFSSNRQQAFRPMLLSMTLIIDRICAMGPELLLTKLNHYNTKNMTIVDWCSVVPAPRS